MCDDEAMKQSQLTVYIVDVPELSITSHDLPLQIELLCIHLLLCCLIPFGILSQTCVCMSTFTVTTKLLLYLTC